MRRRPGDTRRRSISRGASRAKRKRAVTPDTDLRLCRFFGLSDGWWLRLQADYDTEVARSGLAEVLAKIRPWKETAE
jgi:plasmid maintenance system antidote protein VapI